MASEVTLLSNVFPEIALVARLPITTLLIDAMAVERAVDCVKRSVMQHASFEKGRLLGHATRLLDKSE